VRALPTQNSTQSQPRILAVAGRESITRVLITEVSADGAELATRARIA